MKVPADVSSPLEAVEWKRELHVARAYSAPSSFLNTTIWLSTVGALDEVSANAETEVSAVGTSGALVTTEPRYLAITEYDANVPANYCSPHQTHVIMMPITSGQGCELS
jgi:hypothetical protein